MQKNLNDLLTQKGISVAYGESVCNLDEITTNKRNDGQVLRTKLGSTIVADFVVTSLGEKLNNEFYEKVLASSLTPNGALEVNEHLKVKGHGNIYAMCDVTNIDEEKTPCTPTEHAKVVKENLIAGCNNGKLTAYKAVMEVILVSVGKDAGVSQICGMQLGNFPARMAKGKDRMAGDTWAELGLEIPVNKPDQCHGSKA
uniref:Ferroptosis suppressor protein 1 n=1 Tax=Ciona savignyi TaxID=51511 RepID=H2ZA76_CIOSA